MRVSVIIEWANTRLNGTDRAWQVLELLGKQWRSICERAYPRDLPADAAALLEEIDSRAEMLIVSGEPANAEFEEQVRHRTPDCFDLGVHFAEGLDYYPLKNFGAERATGDILLFVDSDVLAEDGWLAHLLGTFARPEVDAVCGQTYIAPQTFIARAFALGWTYELRDEQGGLHRDRKLNANNMAFRRELFRQHPFPALGSRTRGACRILREELAACGITLWQNSSARVAHPPPRGFRHLAVRALAHGRDQYMARSEKRHLRGLFRSVGVAARRFARGCFQMIRHGRRVGLKLWEIPGVVVVLGSYYGIFALGGLATHLSPQAMGRRYRV